MSSTTEYKHWASACQVSRDASTSSESYLMSMPHHDVRSVAHRCANSSRRTDMAAKWSGITRLEKLRAAVSSRLPETWPPKRVEEYGAKVEAIISAAWSIFGQVADQLPSCVGAFPRLQCISCSLLVSIMDLGLLWDEET